MAPKRTVVDYESVEGDRVERVLIIKTSNPRYPSGWKYSLHYGTIDGETLLRYDNAHERKHGHDRHTPEGVEEIEFPGMMALWRRWRREIEDL